MSATSKRHAGNQSAIRSSLSDLTRVLGGTSMIKFVIRRLLAAIPVLLAIMLVTFALIHALPGGPFNAVGQRRMPDYMVAQLEEKFGLNKPLFFNTPRDGYFPDGDEWKIIGYHDEQVTTGGGQTGGVRTETRRVLRVDLLNSQFFNYVWGALHLDFGPSLNVALRDQNVQVGDEIARRLPVSIQVGVFAIVLGFAIGIPLGVVAAILPQHPVDYLAMFFAVLSQATPAIAWRQS